MYINLFTAELKPGMVEDHARFLKESVAPLLAKPKGFINLFASVNPNTNKIITILIWDSKEASDTFLKDYENEVTQSFAEGAKFFSLQPANEEFEVIAKL
jgi:heme-degrading monooxygenase HmoA